MIKIIDGRGTGKSSRLFLLAKENDGVIVCCCPEAMRNKAYAYGIVGIDFISYSDYLSLSEEYEGRDIYIDDLSRFLYDFDCRISGYTESMEDE